MSPTMRSSTVSDESYCAPWDLQSQEEKLKRLSQQHQVSSLSAHPTIANNRSSLLFFPRTPPAPKKPPWPTVAPLPSPDFVAVHRHGNNSINTNLTLTANKIPNYLPSHTIRSATATSRSFLFAPSSTKQPVRYDSQPMSFETALFRFKCLSSSIHNNSLPKASPSYEQPWEDLPTSYLHNRHGRSLQKLTNVEDSQRHCLSSTCSTAASYRHAIDMTSIPIDRYFWYHYTMSRRQAEQLLESRASGSFLVRQSESGNPADYSLSIKTMAGCVHMRICHSNGFYILGECSRPFPSVAHMIKYFSKISVPIRGAAHIRLGTPVLRCEVLSSSSISNEELL